MSLLGLGIAVDVIRSTTRHAHAVVSGQNSVPRTNQQNAYGVREPDLAVDPESLQIYPPDGQFSYLDGVAREGGLYIRLLRRSQVGARCLRFEH